MRVLVAPEWYPWPERPVYGVFCREHARAVARRHDVAVLAWRAEMGLRAPFSVQEADEDGLRTFRLRFAAVSAPKGMAAFRLAGCASVLARLRRAGWTPHVVHAHEYTAGRVALTLGALARAPVIFTEHYSGFAGLSDDNRRRAKRAFERASLVCPVSRELAEHVRAVAPAARIESVPNVVDTDVFAPASARGRRGVERLVTVGSLIERKAHGNLIMALAALRARGCRLTLDLVGDGPLRQALERQAGDAGVGDVVRFLGAQPKSAVAAAMREADAFVLASLSENLPCVLLEAMSAGLPVVATDVGGVSEAVGSGQGILVEPGSPDALAQGLARLVADADHYDRARLRAHAIEGYGYDAIAGRWAELYAAVLRSRSA
jgi:L-malate glycosyltransferase